MEVHPREKMGRVLAARFPDRRRASHALESLHRRLDETVEAEIAPLATPGEDAADDTLLAGHFDEDQARDVVEIVRASGGEIVADVDERWTRPRRGIDEPHAGGGHVEGGRGFTY